MGIPFSQGVQILLDGQQQYIRGGLDCYIRVGNFVPSGDFIEVGVPYAPTGAAALESGFVDILILPPPTTKPVSMRNIALSGGKLMFGARRFTISDTFVEQMLETYPNIQGRYNVFRNWDKTASVIGIIYNNQMYSIEDIGRREVAGRTVAWLITCNTHEEYLTDGAEQVDQP